MSKEQSDMQTVTHAEQEPVRIRYLFMAMLPSLLLATLLVPMCAGDIEYIESYLFLFTVSVVTAIIGSKQKKPVYVCAAIGLMWIAPFIPIIVLLLMEPFMKQ